MIRNAALTLAAVLALAGCGSDSAASKGKATAEGQILPGSASDAMIPYDRLKSQAPAAARTDAGSTEEKDRDEAPDGD